jgi:anti-sigma regulatory factor (Ser/Thr protein kinase)
MSGCISVAQEHGAPTASESAGSGPAIDIVLRHSALDLRPLPSAVPSARLHAKFVICEWGFPAIASDCELLVAELVTNAVTHAARVVTAADLPPVRLRLSGRGRGVQIEVWDASSEMPQLHSDPLSEEPGGRGLVLVAGLASRWGAYRTEGGGKCTWAMIGQEDAA